MRHALVTLAESLKHHPMAFALGLIVAPIATALVLLPQPRLYQANASVLFYPYPAAVETPVAALSALMRGDAAQKQLANAYRTELWQRYRKALPAGTHPGLPDYKADSESHTIRIIVRDRHPKMASYMADYGSRFLILEHARRTHQQRQSGMVHLNKAIRVAADELDAVQTRLKTETARSAENILNSQAFETERLALSRERILRDIGRLRARLSSSMVQTTRYQTLAIDAKSNTPPLMMMAVANVADAAPAGVNLPLPQKAYMPQSEVPLPPLPISHPAPGLLTETTRSQAPLPPLPPAKNPAVLPAKASVPVRPQAQVAKAPGPVVKTVATPPIQPVRRVRRPPVIVIYRKIPSVETHQLLERISARQTELATTLQRLANRPAPTISTKTISPALAALMSQEDALKEKLAELIARREALRLAMAEAPPAAERLQAPTLKAPPSPWKLIAWSLLLSPLVAMGFALVARLLDDRLYSTDDIEKIIAIPVVQELHTTARTTDTRDFSDILLRPGSTSKNVSPVTHQELSHLQSRLSALTTGEDKVFTLIAPEPGSGTTALLCGLALQFAEAGMRTLILDANLRNPEVHKAFGLDNTQGLAELIDGGVHVRDTLFRLEQRPNLFVMPAGHAAHDPLQILQSSKTRAAMTHFRSIFDVVLLNAPSDMALMDAPAVANLADKTLLLIKDSDATRTRLVAWRRQLAGVRLGTVGLVLNRHSA